jgi:hypothetical protein
MSKNEGRIFWGTLGAVGVVVLVLGITWVFFTKAARVQEAPPAPLALFLAPSQIPQGEESWLLIGSENDLPKDAVLTSASLTLSVLEVQRLSARALGARVLLLGTGQETLTVRSLSQSQEASLSVAEGPRLLPFCLNANVKDDDWDVNGQYVMVGGSFMMYGYLPETGVNFAAVRVHNRQGGMWYRREYAQEKAQREAEAPVPVGPNFVDPDPHETLPDTNGDQIFDFEESPQALEAVPEFLGINLHSGENTLDIVGVDERGFLSWQILKVFSTAPPS